MDYARKHKDGSWKDQDGASFDGAYEALLEAEYSAKAEIDDGDGNMVDATALDGYGLRHCDLYNLDTSDQSQVIYSSGIINYCLGACRQTAIRFKA
jgi:hypothetical protein